MIWHTLMAQSWHCRRTLLDVRERDLRRRHAAGEADCGRFPSENILFQKRSSASTMLPELQPFVA